MQPNAFHRTMLHLDFGVKQPDLFSQACVEQYDNQPEDSYGYLFAQVFEPGVLREIARLERLDTGVVEHLTFGASVRLNALRADLSAVSGMAPHRAVNVAAALVSISRFELAKRVLSGIASSACGPRDKFEIAMLDFAVHNRLADVAGTRHAFRCMREVIETECLPANRVLDAATQAVVWRMKSAQIDQETFEWFLACGRSLASRGSVVDSGAKSSWYRALAMIPAAKGNRQVTRRLMIRARETAEETLHSRSRAYEQHFLKTYHESALKEHIYVSCDRDAALAEAAALIAIDPIWSPSHGELAEAHRKFGEWEAAAAAFERAGRLGPPYVGHHLFHAAQTWERTDQPDRALPLYQELLSLTDTNISVIVAGARLGRRLGCPNAEPFEAALAALECHLGPEHRAYLAG